ncbi:MAG: hypothetical protein GXO05_02455, partial [Aquificae bacterium]|nr:hypothetical protein [Aquificota bacterium]
MKKLYIVIALAIFVTLGLVIFNQFTKEFLQKSAETLDIVKDIEKYEYKLDSDVLKSSFYLYYNYDELYRSISEIEKNILKLKNEHLNHFSHRESRKILYEY